MDINEVADVVGGLTGREYLRVSKDRWGKARSTSEQHQEIIDDAAELGVTLGEPYRDDDRSASKFATKPREDFDRLVNDLRTGDFGADVLFLWESSRGSRQVGEWLELIELCAASGVKIRVTGDRTYDPRNPKDRKSLIVDATDSEYESSQISRRNRRATGGAARLGRPHGQTPFGFQRRYDPETRELVSQDPHPEEAPVVRRLFKLVLKGHSLRSIARTFDTDGIKNRSGRPFSAQHLRTLVMNPAYGGLRAHTAGSHAGYRRAAWSDVTLTEGVWGGLVTREKFLEARAKVTDPSRSTLRSGQAHRAGRAKHLLSMFSTCGNCSSALVVRLKHSKRRYFCREHGCVTVDADELEHVAVDEMMSYLARPQVWEEIQVHAAESTAERDKIGGEIAGIQAEIDELHDAVGNGRVSVAMASRSEPMLMQRLAAAEKRERELATPAVLRGVVDPQRTLGEQWEEMPVAARREVARALLSPSMIGTLVLDRSAAGKRGRAAPGTARERVRFVREGAGVAA